MNRQQTMQQARTLIQEMLDQIDDAPVQNVRIFKVAVDVASDDLILEVASLSRAGKAEEAMALMWRFIFANSATIMAIYRRRYGTTGEVLQ